MVDRARAAWRKPSFPEGKGREASNSWGALRLALGDPPSESLAASNDVDPALDLMLLVERVAEATAWKGV